MTPEAKSTGDSPTWDDVRDEASALTREVIQQSLVWSRRAFKVASSAALATAKAMEEVSERSGADLKGVSERTAEAFRDVTQRTAKTVKKVIQR